MIIERKSLRLTLAVLVGLLLLVGSIAALPDSTPPGVRVITVSSGTTPITADVNYSNFTCQGYAYMDLFYRIDQTVGNTLDLDLEISPEGVNWYSHNDNHVLLDDNASDANGYVDSTPNHGYQCRIVADVTNTEAVTIALKVVLR